MNCAMATAGLYVCTLTYLHTIVDYFDVYVFIKKRECPAVRALSNYCVLLLFSYKEAREICNFGILFTPNANAIVKGILYVHKRH